MQHNQLIKGHKKGQVKIKLSPKLITEDMPAAGFSNSFIKGHDFVGVIFAAARQRD